MKRLTQIHQVVIAAGLLVCSGASLAAGLMTPINSGLEELKIRQHHVNVVIEDGYAVTQVEQVFFNPHAQDLEAVYSFPVPDKAAVGEFTYWIDGMPVTGEVVAKQKADEIYQAEKDAGREVAKTEKDEYRTFDISVYPVRASQEVRTRLSYVQAAHVDTSIGRYVYPLEEGGVDEEKLSFWTYNEAVEQQFSFNLLFRSSYPIDQLRLPKHPQAVITQLSAQEWQVVLANGQADAEEGSGQAAASNAVFKLDTDIVVYWRHQQGLPGSVDMITHKEPGNDRGTFMLTVTPGDDLGSITEGRDWTFVLDYSGSMSGKYHSLVEGVRKGLHKLQPNDRFRVVLFNNQVNELTSGYLTASPGNVERIIQQLEHTQPDGGTNLFAGLERAIKRLDADRSSAIILVTDGVANVGRTEKKDFLELMKKHDVRLFTFIMGNSANTPLLEGMTSVSNGFAVSISNSDDIVGKIMEATSKLTHQALHDVKLNISGIKVKDLSPEHIGSLYRGQQLIVFGHYWGSGNARVSLEGKVSGAEKTYSTEFDFPEQSTLYPEIERMWAYAKIEDLQNRMDYYGQDKDMENAVTDLAIEHGLVTDYTSMIVLREEQFQRYGIERLNAKRVEQEHLARSQRQQQAVTSHRVDNRQPMYQNPAPTHSSPGGGGSGAFGPWSLLLLLGALLLRQFDRARG